MAPRSRRSLRTPPRATRAKPAFSYAEPDSASDFESDGDVVSDLDRHATHLSKSLPSRPQKSSNPATPSKKRHRPTTRSLNSDDEIISERRTKKRKKSKSNTPKSLISHDSSSFNVQTSGKVPPWQSLPYHILLQIFQYASYPLYDDHTFQPLPNGAPWLLKVSRLCRPFSEPALTVIYATPPLIPMDKAHNLADLLNANPKSLTYKYRQKVESLQIDVDQVVAYSLQGRGHLDLHGLIRNLPRLVALEFYLQKDMSPYRDLDVNIKWHYPDDLFDALDYVDPQAEPQRGDKTSVCKLGSWRWSSRLAGKIFPIKRLQTVHTRPAFEALRKIAFVNYQVPYVKANEEDPKHEEILARSLSPLKNLEHLIFESSTLVNAILLPLLPKNLRNLELINCWNIKADELAEFLLSHGSQLRCLTLNHNQSLSLSFLPILGTACPKLQVFRMNLTYFQLHSTYRDSDPLYEQLLLPDQVPVWPSTLQTIELIQLRQWQTEAAEMFFQSLLDSAADLPDLRRLTIQAILNIGWRDRATFRDKWVGSLNRVFKRVSPPPEKHDSLSTSKLSFAQLPFSRKQLDGQIQAATPTEHRSLRSSSGSSSSSAKCNVLSVEQEPQTSKQVEKVKAKKAACPTSRRSTRTSTRQVQTGTYAESPEHSDTEEPDSDARSTREVARSTRLAHELATLKKTAGRDLLPSSPPKTPSEDEDSNDAPLVKRNKGKEKEIQVIQGLCEVVDVRIDNLRPRETQATEADFLDEEAPGDGDWNGDDDFDDGYAW